MSEQTKKVALPAYLPKRLEAFKISKDDQPSYLLRDKLLNKVHDLEPWQFFLLEVLPGCETYPKLQSVFEDRFGRPITQKQIEEFFASLADRQLLDMENPTHELLQRFRTKGYDVKDGTATVKSHVANVAASHAEAASVAAAAVASAAGHAAPPVPPKAPGAAAAAPGGDLPAGVNDAAGFDPRATRWMLKLFDPRPMLKLLAPVVAPLRFLVYIMPLMALAAVLLSLEYSHLIREDLANLHNYTTLFEHVLFSLFTVNLAVTLTQAFIAHAYRATVAKFGISVFMGFLPRFLNVVTHTEQMTRRERMWLNAGPLLVRVFLFSLGMLIWYNTRDSAGTAAKIGLALGIICAIDLVFASGNPLVKGSGYHLLSAFMNEPRLRGKSYKTLLNRMRGQTFKESDNSVLAAYALASTVYAFVLILISAIIVGVYLQSVMLGGTALFLAALMAIYLGRRSIRRLQMIEAAYDRSVQFDRWRKRTLPDAVGEAEDTLKPRSAWSHYGKIAAVVTLLLLLVMPYPYEPGGRFLVYPFQKQVITSDIGGVIQKVNFEGGESIKKGAVLATLSTLDYQSEVSVYNARIAEQQAVVADLKARPKPEEVEVASRQLQVAQEHERFTKDRVPRLEAMYKDGTVSFEELDSARREYQVDVSQVAEKKASLALAKTGATKDQIEAAVAKLQSLNEERDMYQSKVGRGELIMPFDGNLLTLHLQDRTNSYLEKGAPFASVENTNDVTVEVEVPETDLAFVKVGTKVRVRPVAFSDQFFDGEVITIDRNVTQQSFGTVVKVVAKVKNPDQSLRTGMTGYAKMDGNTMPVWKAFSLAIQRFLNVQVWSWIP
ncbi:MAG TPA: efflux RND transporter periplasmic adaptor subunit [Ideonella sp.]|uniref:HlyD family secretion protein n=1 Tax=Ideonella sp. TaxID=1929293 RepID=UPI002C89A348|nr:efflux RND transporter periplasmic adaptor subunit [Ideonella sp.]HSI47228.1 efflux RND transporter periplasmic adaptor subunit [Ideonella sp.]